MRVVRSFLKPEAAHVTLDTSVVLDVPYRRFPRPRKNPPGECLSVEGRPNGHRYSASEILRFVYQRKLAAVHLFVKKLVPQSEFRQTCLAEVQNPRPKVVG